MVCPNCGSSSGGKNFCGDCGSPLPWRCACGNENPPSNNLCSDCGGVAPERSPAAARRKRIAGTAQPERRQLTIMFADLVGSTALGARLDPEDLRDVMAAYYDCVADLVGRFGGFIARYLGDGVLAYFGYPQAHEDDAERAVRAGLGISAAVGRLATTAGPAGTLSVRIGIATGVAIVGDLVSARASLESTVVGESANLAARLQTIAEPGMVVVAESTRRLAGGLFEYRDLGPATLKGLSAPVGAWAVSGESSIDSRFEALRASRSRLFGRGEEMELLLRRWEQARTGEGCVVMLSGDAGIGKSRLVAALWQELQKTPHAFIHWICSAHYQDIPLYPVIRQIERSAGVLRGEPAAVKLDKLRAWLGAGARAPAELAAVAGLLSIPGTGEGGMDAVAPEYWKEAIFGAILQQLEREARNAPVLLAIEDLHWADPTSLDLLNAISERAERLKLLLLVTARPSIQPVWAARSQITVLFLNALNRRDATALIKNVAGARTLPENVLDRIIAHADGVPLFLEELTKTVLETGLPRSASAPVSRFQTVSMDVVPTTLQASLMARLDALPLGKEVAQIGAVIGRDFSFETLQAVSNLPAERLEETLDDLLQAELILVRGRPPKATYTFKHTLVQDAAYASLLRSRRRLIHRRVAEILETGIAGAAQSEPQLVAWHCAEAGAAEKSIDFYLAAAAQTTGRFAIAETVSQLQKGLAQLKHLPDSTQTQRRELALQVALGRALIDHRGSGSTEVGAAFERARVLCLALDDRRQLLPIFDGLMLNYHFAHAEPMKMLGYADELFKLGQRAGDRQLLLWARRSRSSANLLQGHFENARAEMQIIIGAYENEQDGPADIRVARDPRVSTSMLLGICLTAMGYPVSGAAVSLKGLKHAQSAQHAESLILGLRRACVQRMLQRDVAGVLDLSTRLLGMNAEHETFMGALEGTIFHGWALLQTREDGALVRDVQTCLDQLEAAKHWVMLPFLMTSIAEARAGHGDVDGATDLLDRAANLIEVSGQRWSEAELLRLRARLATRGPDKTVALLQASLAMAREQGATLWALRTATSLAEFWRDEGRGGRARDVLAPVFNGFTEGFDAPDLVAARTLLDELARLTA